MEKIKYLPNFLPKFHIYKGERRKGGFISFLFFVEKQKEREVENREQQRSEEEEVEAFNEGEEVVVLWFLVKKTKGEARQRACSESEGRSDVLLSKKSSETWYGVFP